jgi:hypothetical protein
MEIFFVDGPLPGFGAVEIVEPEIGRVDDQITAPNSPEG